MKNIAVIDVGKTNIKVALVNLELFEEQKIVSIPNESVYSGQLLTFNTEFIWEFICNSLKELSASIQIEGIGVTTHGAAAVLIMKDGTYAEPLDYEDPTIDSIAGEYSKIRPHFEETGSPHLAGGLNIGSQLYLQFKLVPKLREKLLHIVTYPQFWGWKLTGKFATDFTSLGCHTDLWSPKNRDFSTLVKILKIDGKIPFPKKPNEFLGNLSLPTIDNDKISRIPVSVGIHDSNASLVPHLYSQTTPFSVISTGTWVVVLSVGGKKIQLDPARDTLLNVNLFGKETPSARFMGGREYEIEAGDKLPEHKDHEKMFEDGLILLPSIINDVGPFQKCNPRWEPYVPEQNSGLRNLVTSYYLAMITCECLEQIGHIGKIILEGPFTKNRHFMNMLSVMTETKILVSKSATGTTIGTSMLFLNELHDTRINYEVLDHNDKKLLNFGKRWKEKINLHRNFFLNK